MNEREVSKKIEAMLGAQMVQIVMLHSELEAAREAIAKLEMDMMKTFPVDLDPASPGD